MNRTAWQIAIFSAASALGGTYLFGGEWLRYFSYFGTWGTFGVLLVSLMVTWLTSNVLLLISKTGVRSHTEFLGMLFGEKAAPSLSFLMVLLLLWQVGTTLGQQSAAITSWIGLPSAVSIVLLISLTFLLVRLRLASLLKSAIASLAAGFLLLGALFFVQYHVPMPPLSYQFGSAWLWHALFYVCLHALFLLSVFLPSHSEETGNMDTKSIQLGSLAGGLLFLVITLIGHFAILAHWHDAHSLEQPLFAILNSLSPMLAVPFFLASLLQAGFLGAVLIRSISQPLIFTYDLRPTPVHLLFLLLAALLAFGASLLDGFSQFAELPGRLLGFIILVRLFQSTTQKSP